ncbi:MAG: hypothetical protein K8J09_16115 [Planctomycetes bacterium]|nr:hypothetical protein [Planctomycetota bacterium]MCC7397214.1 hypothetical protein [Planctomycetota bacterium]
MRNSAVLAAQALGLLLTCPAVAGVRHQEPTDPERLRAMLAAPGPDGREQRERAIEQILVVARPDVHRLLQERLLRGDDPDQVRPVVLAALQRHLLLGPSSQFGGAATDDRLQILTGYLGAMSPFWLVAGKPGSGLDATTAPLRDAARLALQRVPARELDTAARRVMTSLAVPGQIAVLRCLADLQQVLLTVTIADYLEVSEPDLRDGARAALQLLTYEDEPIQTKAQFDAWYANRGNLRYIDLVEWAARGGLRPTDRLRAELARVRVDLTREIVRALVVRANGIDWVAVQAKTLVDDATVLDACLEQLQQVLPSPLPLEDNPVPRHTFCRGLLQRFRSVTNEHGRRRALLLEVASALIRPEELELSAEVTTQLLLLLDSEDAVARSSALRGLRRLPTPEVRQRVVSFARGLLPQGAAARDQLATAIATLSSRAAPRWTAPLSGDPDRADWLALVEACCRTPAGLELREPALLLAQTLDSKNQRVAEVFVMLLGLATDPSLDAKFRGSCLVHLQGWGSEVEHADAWVRALHGLLADSAVELRLTAAESLTHLPESSDARRVEWITQTFVHLRDRLCVEPDIQVLRALVDCLQVCGREPQMPEKAIGALKGALAQLGPTPAVEHQFRLEPLLQALAAIAANTSAERGIWLAACRPLLDNKRRQSLRNVLKSHAAIELAKEVGSGDASVADRARQAMYVLIETATLKAPRTGWNDSEDLQNEARDVRAAFGALDKLEEPLRLDKPVHRLLRLELDLAAGKYPEVVVRANTWLSAPVGSAPAGEVRMTAEERQRMQLLAAEAHLASGKPDQALRLIEEANPDLTPAVLELDSRVARALAEVDLPRAVTLFDKVWRATLVEDAAFRQRLVDWMQARLRQESEARDVVVRESDKYVDLFAASDCPPDLRASFERLRAAR